MTGLLDSPRARNLVRAEGLDIDACATVEFLAIGAHAVSRGQVTSRDRALVIGAGPIGLGAALFAVLSGAEVTGPRSRRLRASRPPRRCSVPTPYRPATRRSTPPRHSPPAKTLTSSSTPPATRPRWRRASTSSPMAGAMSSSASSRAPITFEDADFPRKEMTLLGSRNALSSRLRARHRRHPRGAGCPLDRIITHRTTLAGAVTRPAALGHHQDRPHQGPHRHRLKRRSSLLAQREGTGRGRSTGGEGRPHTRSPSSSRSRGEGDHAQSVG